MYQGAKSPPALSPPPAVGQPQPVPPARDQRHSKAPSVPRDGSKLGTSYMAANSKALLHLQLANRSQPPCLQSLSLINFFCAPPLHLQPAPPARDRRQSMAPSVPGGWLQTGCQPPGCQLKDPPPPAAGQC